MHYQESWVLVPVTDEQLRAREEYRAEDQDSQVTARGSLISYRRPAAYLALKSRFALMWRFAQSTRSMLGFALSHCGGGW